MKTARHCCQCCWECLEKHHPNRNRFRRSATTKQIPSKNKSQRPSSDKVAPFSSHFSAFHPGYHRDQILISTHSILSNIDQTGNLPACSHSTQHVTHRAKCHRKFRNMGENSPASLGDTHRAQPPTAAWEAFRITCRLCWLLMLHRHWLRVEQNSLMDMVQ